MKRGSLLLWAGAALARDEEPLDRLIFSRETPTPCCRSWLDHHGKPWIRLRWRIHRRWIRDHDRVLGMGITGAAGHWASAYFPIGITSVTEKNGGYRLVASAFPFWHQDTIN